MNKTLSVAMLLMLLGGQPAQSLDLDFNPKKISRMFLQRMMSWLEHEAAHLKAGKDLGYEGLHLNMGLFHSSVTYTNGEQSPVFQKAGLNAQQRLADSYLDDWINGEASRMGLIYNKLATFLYSSGIESRAEYNDLDVWCELTGQDKNYVTATSLASTILSSSTWGKKEGIDFNQYLLNDDIYHQMSLYDTDKRITIGLNKLNIGIINYMNPIAQTYLSIGDKGFDIGVKRNQRISKDINLEVEVGYAESDIIRQGVESKKDGWYIGFKVKLR